MLAGTRGGPGDACRGRAGPTRVGPWTGRTGSPELLADRLAARGITRPWEHQATAASLAWSGRSVVVATGTASGKSLAYQLPVLSSLLADEKATALYLAPTKALAADQLRSLRSLVLSSVRAASYDGDTAPPERDWVRSHSRLVLTNPDMLHRGILPSHARWAAFLRRLRYVVVDECHTYRGVFGSHVAHVLRRLRRVCASYGAHPTFVLASATVARAGRVGQPADRRSPVDEVTEDASPARRDRLRALGAAADRRPTASTARRCAGRPARGGAAARRPGGRGRPGARLRPLPPGRRGGRPVGPPPPGGDRARAGRPGRRLPGGLPAGGAARAGGGAGGRRRCSGVAATNALELGVDIAGLDAVVLAGFPGTLASLWQQAGRAGREGLGALRRLRRPGRPARHLPGAPPEAVFGRPVEATVLDPENPYVLGPQLCCAAAELALTEADLPLFGGAGGRGRAARPGAPRAAAAPPDRLVLDRSATARPGHPGHRRRAGPGRRGRHRPGARHRRRLGVALDRPPGRGLPAPGRVLPGGRAGPGGRRRAGARGRRPTGPPPPGTPPTSASSRRCASGTSATSTLHLGTVDVTNQVVVLPAAPPPHRRGAGRDAAGPAGTRAADQSGLVHALGRRAWPGPASRRPTCRERRTPPSTRRSACCRSSPPATGGTSAASRPRCTPTPGG